MDKIKLNNEIVLMRKYVKQAKVHAINKLTKQVKLLQNRKGNEDQVQKAQRKAERYLEEVAILKKIKPDTISKLALSKAKDWEDVLKQKNPTLDDRCIAKLANFKKIQDEVEAFHNSNKELVTRISDLIKQWDEKNKYSKKSTKGKLLPTQKEKEINPQTEGEKESDIVERLLLIANGGGKNNKSTSSDSNKKNKEMLSKNKVSDENKSDINYNKIENAGEVVKLDSDIRDSIQIKESYSYEAAEKNSMEVDYSNVSKKIEHKDVIVKSPKKVTKKDCNLKNKTKFTFLDKNENFENAMEIEASDVDESITNDSSDNEGSAHDDSTDEEKSEHEDSSENEKFEHDDSSDNKESEHDNSVIKNKNKISNSEIFSKQLSNARKIDSSANSSEKKLKTIALLNLDELQGLEEIPVNKTPEKDQSSDSAEELNEGGTTRTSQNKRNDPFFLGCGGDDDDEMLDPKQKLADFHGSNRFAPKHKNLAFSNISRGLQNKINSSFKRSKSSKHHENRNHKQFPKNVRDQLNTAQIKQHKKVIDNSDDKPLHPSWEAKRKQKESTKASFQGKRIVFDD